ncbi:MAG TPA: carboxyltransferase domain-containing protein, partial [Acidimicrobiales bacterium]|nr:carboxyltransferase domain-containing protein [Acidimicrobiales bacterium]
MNIAGTTGEPVALGGAACLLPVAGYHEAQAVAASIRRAAIPGLTEVVPAADTVGLVYDPLSWSLPDLQVRLAQLVVDAEGPLAGAALPEAVIEVCYDGPDLPAVAVRASMRPEDVVDLLQQADLRVGWIGFMPGFPYIVGLPEALTALPRLARPRARVPAGSLGLGGSCAGIYPASTPGGWNLIGTTNVVLFDDHRVPPARLLPGRRLRLRAVDRVDPLLARPQRPAQRARTRRFVTVVDPGPLTTVRDSGRAGVAYLGVPPSGPADPLSHAIANLAVGNAPGAAAFELTAAGLTLRCHCDTFVAVAGDCQLFVDNSPVPAGAVLPVVAGQVLRTGRLQRRSHAYVAVSGGLDVPAWLGSRSAGVAGFGPPALAPGDELDVGELVGKPRGLIHQPATAQVTELTMMPGPDGVGDLLAGEWAVAADSDRIGTRLQRSDGSVRSGAWSDAGAIPSRMAVSGAVQVPPDGDPIVLGPDHGTVGG